MALLVLLLELTIDFKIVLLLASVVLIDTSSHLFESLGLIIHFIIIIVLLHLLHRLLLLLGAAIDPGSPEFSLGQLLIRVWFLILKLFYVDLLQLIEGPPIKQDVVVLVVNVCAGDHRHLCSDLSLGLPLALLLLLLLPVLLHSLDGLLELLVVLFLQFLLVLLVFGLGGQTLVLVLLGLLAVLVHEALILVAEFQKREKLATALNLKVLADELEVLGWGDSGESLGFGFRINDELKKLA